MSFSAADAFIYKSDLLLSPGSMMPMGDHNIGGFDEGPLEIVVGLLAHAAITGLSAAGMYFRNHAGVGCEVPSSGEAIDGTDLAFDDDGEDVSHTGDGFQALHVRCELNTLEHAFFEGGYLLHGGIEKLKLLIDATACFWREFLDSSIEPGSTFSDEDVRMPGGIESILGESSVDPVLESCAHFAERHAGAVKLAFVADLTWRQPYGGETTEMDQCGEALRIELVGFVDVAHDYLGFGGMSQKRNTSSLFNLVDDPVVVADGFNCNRCPFREIGKELLDGTRLVIDPRLFSG